MIDCTLHENFRWYVFIYALFKWYENFTCCVYIYEHFTWYENFTWSIYLYALFTLYVATHILISHYKSTWMDSSRDVSNISEFHNISLHIWTLLIICLISLNMSTYICSLPLCTYIYIYIYLSFTYYISICIHYFKVTLCLQLFNHDELSFKPSPFSSFFSNS